MSAQRLPHAMIAALCIGLLAALPSHACSQQNLGEQYPQDAQGQYELAKAYATNCDRAEALKWYKLAAEQGHAGAQREVGEAYLFAYRLPKEIIDEAEAVKWFTRSAEQGNVEAAMLLSSFYASKADYAKALEWIKPHAEQGNVEAQIVLGLFIYRQDGATEQDLKESRKWLRLAAEQGDVGSQVLLGEIYMLGKEVAADKVEGIKWFRLAAEQKDGVASIRLAATYLKGEGVEQNRETAREFLKLSFPKIEGEVLENVLNGLEEMTTLENKGYEFDNSQLHKLEQALRQFR
jgi:TPR repeat protein